MQMVDAQWYLNEKLPYHIFLKMFSILPPKVMMKIAAVTVFHDYINFDILADEWVKVPYDVGALITYNSHDIDLL